MAYIINVYRTDRTSVSTVMMERFLHALCNVTQIICLQRTDLAVLGLKPLSPESLNSMFKPLIYKKAYVSKVGENSPHNLRRIPVNIHKGEMGFIIKPLSFLRK